MVPPTSNTTILAPALPTQVRRLPAPESFRLVTRQIMPPRPPTDTAPLPCAPGKAATDCAREGGTAQQAMRASVSQPGSLFTTTVSYSGGRATRDISYSVFVSAA